MAGHKKEKLLIKGPVYPGGQKAMLFFIQKNLRYPGEAIESKVEGTVRIRFSIDHQGKVFKSQIIGGIGHGCDEEAQRLVGLLVFIVSKSYKLRVQYHRILNIHFKLPVLKEPSSDQKMLDIHYHISIAKPNKEVETLNEKNYQYTIKLDS